MAKNSITDYDNTSGNNTDVQSVDISEGCSPSGINNAIREIMADLADVNDGTVALTSPQVNSLTLNGNANFGDNDKAQFGNANDLQIYHDGSHSYINDTGTGNLKIRAANFEIQDSSGTNTIISAVSSDGEARLNYGGSMKLNTTSTGIDVTGTVTLGDGHTIGDDGNDNLTLTSSSGENIKYDAAGGNHLFLDAGTERMRIASGGGNVGIGLSSPEARLDVLGNSDTITALKIGPNANFGHHFYDSAANGDLVIKREASGVQNETMRLSRSGGYVSMPSQPSAFFQGNSGSNHSYGVNGIITNFNFSGNGAFHQGGISHNSGNGRISVPIAGRYLCGMTFYDNDNATTAARVGIRQNGAMRGHTHLEMHNGQNAVTVLLNMAANDYIDFQQIYGTAIYMGPFHFYGFITKLN